MNFEDSVKRIFCNYTYVRSAFDRVTTGMVPIGACIGAILVKNWSIKYSRRRWLIIGDLVGCVGFGALAIYFLAFKPDSYSDWIEFCLDGSYLILFIQIIVGVSVGILSTTSMVMIG